MAKMPMTPGVCLRGPAVRRAQSFHGYARSFYRLPQAVQKESEEEEREVRRGACQEARGSKRILQCGDLPQTASSSTSLLGRQSLSPSSQHFRVQSPSPGPQAQVQFCPPWRLSCSPDLLSKDTAGGARPVGHRQRRLCGNAGTAPQIYTLKLPLSGSLKEGSPAGSTSTLLFSLLTRRLLGTLPAPSFLRRVRFRFSP